MRVYPFFSSRHTWYWAQLQWSTNDERTPRVGSVGFRRPDRETFAIIYV